MAFKKAEKSQSKLRLAIFGPAGAGKTYTALRIASGMGGTVALIDTEHGSAAKYADRFLFDTDNLDQPKISALIEKMGEASEYDVLIIDSLSHSWQELLEEMDKLANAKYKGNSWSAWSEGTPKQRELVRAILSFPGHIIATMRSKTEWTSEKDSNGKSRPQRVGLAPEQGKGIEYEFDMLMEISPDHYANVIKDRTGKYQDAILEKPGEKFGAELVEWLNTGEPLARDTPSPSDYEIDTDTMRATLQAYYDSGKLRPAALGPVRSALDDGLRDPIILRDLIARTKAHYERVLEAEGRGAA